MSWTGGPLDGRRLMMKSSVILRRYLVTTYQISKFLSIHVVPSYFGFGGPFVRVHDTMSCQLPILR